MFQYRKRYSPVQPTVLFSYLLFTMFQYRKRYSPVQHAAPKIEPRQYSSFNTASGIRLCNWSTCSRKQDYGSFNTASGIRLCNDTTDLKSVERISFNTASGIRLCNSIPAEAARVLA